MAKREAIGASFTNGDGRSLRVKVKKLPTQKSVLRGVEGLNQNDRDWILTWWNCHVPRFDGEVKALRELGEIAAMWRKAGQ